MVVVLHADQLYIRLTHAIFFCTNDLQSYFNVATIMILLSGLLIPSIILLVAAGELLRLMHAQYSSIVIPLLLSLYSN